MTGLFSKARSRKLSKDVSGGSVALARKSAKKLQRDFSRAKTHKGKLSVFHATLDEANRLETIRRTRALKESVKRSLKVREGVFRSAYKKMGKRL